MPVDDNQLRGMGKKSLIAEVLQLRQAIRLHRDQKGDDRCWLDDLALYEVLPEGTRADLTLPPRDVFLKNCERFWECRRANQPWKGEAQ